MNETLACIQVLGSREIQPVCLKSARKTVSSAPQASWDSIHILMWFCLLIISALWSLTESRLNVGITK